MIHHVEYLRPDGWWHLVSYDDAEVARIQMEKQMENYPGAAYRVRPDMPIADDLAVEDEREGDPTVVQMSKLLGDDASA